MQLSPEQMLIVIAAAGAAIMVATFIVGRVLWRQQPQTAGAPMPAQMTSPPSATVRQPTPSAQQSYTAIAVTATGGAAPKPATAATPIRIDYSNALGGIQPDASYTAMAVANAAQGR